MIVMGIVVNFDDCDDPESNRFQLFHVALHIHNLEKKHTPPTNHDHYNIHLHHLSIHNIHKIHQLHHLRSEDTKILKPPKKSNLVGEFILQHGEKKIFYNNDVDQPE